MGSIRLRLLSAAIAIAVLALLIARNEGYLGSPGEKQTPAPPTVAAAQPTAAPTATASPTPTPLPIASGQPVPPVVTETLVAGIAQDMAKLTPLLHYQRVACVADPPQGAGGPPRCAPGEADGTTAEYMLVAGCEGAWLRAAAVPEALRAALTRAHDLYAAAILPPDPSWPKDVAYGKYVVVFAPPDPKSPDALAVYLDDTGIVRITAGCARPDQRVRDRTGAAFTFLVAPRDPLPQP